MEVSRSCEDRNIWQKAPALTLEVCRCELIASRDLGHCEPEAAMAQLEEVSRIPEACRGSLRRG